MHSFFAMMSRIKYINRWGLMNNTRNETLSEHSLEVAIIAHALGVINNKTTAIISIIHPVLIICSSFLYY